VGGAERVTAGVLRRLPREGFDSRLYFIHEAGIVGRELIAEGFPGIERLANGRRDVGTLLRLVRLFRHDKPDVVYCLDHHDAMTFGRIAGLSCGAKGMIVASHATGLVGRTHAFDRVDRMLMDFTSHVIAVSRPHARYLHQHEGLPASTLRVIENGIDPAGYPAVTLALRADARAALDLPADEPVVLMVAGMRPEKAHEALLAAVARLRDQGRRVTALLAGDGPRRGALETIAVSLGISGSVRFLGIRNDVARLLHAADVTVLPSHGVVETLPLAVLESMAVGIPVVASAVGSVGEIVVDGETGILIRPADSVALAGGIAYILDHPQEASAMGARGRELVCGRFTITRTAEDYEALFQELTAA
jgi:glycosyltransferase involved in cell wall biosynthesis